MSNTEVAKDLPLTLDSATAAVEVDTFEQLRQMRSAPSRFSQVRLGSSFCEELLPTGEEVNRALEVCATQKMALAIVTPFVTNKGLDQVLMIVEIMKGAGLELVVNDWGVLSSLSKSGLPLTAGRLLTRTRSDPRIAQVWEKLSPQKKDGYRRKPLLAEGHRERLSGLRLEALEIDIPPWGIELPQETLANVFCHQPLCYVTVSRWCPTRAAIEGKHVFSDPCPRPCLDLVFRLWNSATGQILLRGNAYFVSSGPIIGVRVASAIIPYWWCKNREILETAVVQ